MRVLILGFFLTAAAGYSAGAWYLFRHERTAQSLDAARAMPASELRQPEAALALIRDAMEANDFTPRVKELVDHSLSQLPSFYQPFVYEALYYANRLEEPARTREAFEAAMARFPANGRLRLDYARWLLMAPASGTRDEGEHQLKSALQFEPDLTPQALDTLQRYAVTPERWSEVVPDEVDARRLLVLGLAQAGHRNEALALLKPLLARVTEENRLRQAAYWALSWGDPTLALQAVDKWSSVASPRFEPHEPGLVAARAHLALGEVEQAYDVFRTTLREVRPSSSSGLKLLCGMGEEYSLRRRFVLAESIFTEATSYSPRHVCALLGLARIHRQQGNDPDAVEYYRKLLEVDPENEPAQRELTSLMARAP